MRVQNQPLALNIMPKFRHGKLGQGDWGWMAISLDLYTYTRIILSERFLSSKDFRKIIKKDEKNINVRTLNYQENKCAELPPHTQHFFPSTLLPHLVRFIPHLPLLPSTPFSPCFPSLPFPSIHHDPFALSFPLPLLVSLSTSLLYSRSASPRSPLQHLCTCTLLTSHIFLVTGVHGVCRNMEALRVPTHITQSKHALTPLVLTATSLPLSMWSQSWGQVWRTCNLSKILCCMPHFSHFFHHLSHSLFLITPVTTWLCRWLPWVD